MHYIKLKLIKLKIEKNKILTNYESYYRNKKIKFYFHQNY